MFFLILTSIAGATFIIERGLALRWKKVIPPEVETVPAAFLFDDRANRCGHPPLEADLDFMVDLYPVTGLKCCECFVGSRGWHGHYTSLALIHVINFLSRRPTSSS